MSKTVSFRIKLNVDGKDQLVTATSYVKDLQHAMNAAKDGATQFRDKLITFNQINDIIGNLSSSISGLNNIMQGLSSSYNASQQANVQLTTVMKQRMNATEEDIKQVKQVIDVQKQLGVVGGLVQMRGAQQVATFLQEKQSLEVLIPAMNNLLAQQKGLNATEEDAYGVANLMGKAMQGQTSALKRVGITFTDAEKNVMEYGNESQRAAMLAQIITNNVGEMNAQLGKTDGGRIKQQSNDFAALKVQIGAVVTQFLPYVSFGAQFLTIGTGIFALANSVKGAATAFASLGIVTKIGTASLASLRTTSIGASAVMAQLKANLAGTTVGATTATVATKALGAAVKGLVISTGVGLVIATLGEVIAQLSAKSSQSADNLHGMSEAEMATKQAHEQTAREISQLSTAMDINISKLKNFKGSKAEEKKLVEEMNTTYGGAMGYYSTVSQWYTALTNNSKAYCAQMVNEIKMRQLANDIANDDKELNDITHDENGNARKYSKRNKTRTVTHVRGGDPNAPDITTEEVEIKGSSDLAKAQTKYNAVRKSRDAKKRQMERLASQNFSYQHFEGYSATNPGTSTTSTPHVKTGKTGGTTTTKEEKPAAKGSMDWYDQEMQRVKKLRDATGSEDEAKKWQLEYERLEGAYGELKIRLGIEAPKESEVEDVKSQLESKLDVYSTAQQKGGQVQQAFDAGIIDKDEAERQIKEINDELNNILGKGVKPIELEVEMPDSKELEQLVGSLNGIDLSSFSNVQSALEAIASIPKPMEKGMSAAGAACGALGASLQKLGGDGEAAKAGMVMSAIGQMVLSFSQAMVSASSNWITWLAFGVSGIAQLTSLISTVGQFATGGIVPGNQKSGDKLLARVNSGEMILNTRQQSKLFAMLDGREKWSIQGPTVPVSRYGNMNINLGDVSGISGTASGGEVRFEIDGRKLIGVLRNETRISSKSGRRTGIVI